MTRSVALYRDAGSCEVGVRRAYYSRAERRRWTPLSSGATLTDDGPPSMIGIIDGRTGQRSGGLERLEQLCAHKGMRMTDQRRVVARVLSVATDHPDVEELHRRAHAVDPTSRSPPSTAPCGCSRSRASSTRHDFRDGRSRYEEASESTTTT